MQKPTLSDLDRLTALGFAAYRAKQHDPQYAEPTNLGCLTDPSAAAELLSDIKPHLIGPATTALIEELQQLSESNIRARAIELKDLAAHLEEETTNWERYRP